MGINLVRAFGFLLAVVLSAFANADEQVFKPYELVGDWQFTNANTGVKFGGDIKIKVNSLESAGVMRGLASYDGRQTNDNCSTRAMFSDQPVEAEIIRAGSDYRISFLLKCSRGESPRMFSWTLVCTEASCSQLNVLPHGRGVILLKEVH